jgi:hypothetical protein
MTVQAAEAINIPRMNDTAVDSNSLLLKIKEEKVYVRVWEVINAK